ncbi:MAG TPA: multiheme c-type cytochrome [Opitutaceae bacterium]|nr:multiheme c-type cytochrome [Opitutaceae bacterium]
MTLQQKRLCLWAALAAWLAAAAAASLPGPQADGPSKSGATAAKTVERPAVKAAALTSDQCKRCHESIYTAWAASQHAQANRPVEASVDRSAFDPARHVAIEAVQYEIGWRDGRPEVTEKQPGAAATSYRPDLVIGVKPLRQYVVATSGGRYQAAELAYDPLTGKWFDVFGSDRRQPGDWGYWRGRGMNWNSMCAACHMTDYHKNYDLTKDTYASTWLEQGIGCVQCHGDITAEHLTATYPPAIPRAPDAAAAHRAMETCVPCHARNEMLTGEIHPGGAYADRYRVTLPVEQGVFYPDGQVQAEDYNWTSFLLSRMGGHGGVTCLDCHDPHSGRTVLPVDNNQLCLQCHATGRLHAPIINPTQHSHHADGSTGNACVSCHMPTTVYMQVDPRHDHGFLRPDPLLTKELGIPNACNRCHQDKTVDWAIKATDMWYGAAMASRQRERARLVDAARKQQPALGTRLADMLGGEDIPAWRATLLVLARPYLTDEPRLVDAARQALGDSDANVRSAAVQALASLSGPHPELRPLLSDPMKLVRIDAELALSPELAEGSAGRRELDGYFAANADQPNGQLQWAQDLFNRGQLAEAEVHVRKAAAWDPNSGAEWEMLGMLANAQGRPADAADLLWRAAGLEPDNPTPAFEAGLAYAAARDLAGAEKALRAAVARNPQFDRAWYDLALALSQTGRGAEAVDALRKAEAAAPRVADYPYARATIEVKLGHHAAALEAAKRAAALAPGDERVAQLVAWLERTGE